MNYAEQLAQTIFFSYNDMDTTGAAAEFLDKAYEVATKELGIKQAKAFFHGPDFEGDLIDAYKFLKEFGMVR